VPELDRGKLLLRHGQREVTMNGFLARLAKRLTRWLFGDSTSGQDPDANVRAPKGRGPSGRRSTAAVAEPGDPVHVRAVGSSLRRRSD
jgi:hypothetical protein